MRSMDAQRRAQRRMVGNFSGDNLDQPNVWASQVRNAPAYADVLALPPDADNVIDLNDPSGNLYFVPGVSDPSGDDVLI
jgi:hypothetical protein